MWFDKLTLIGWESRVLLRTLLVLTLLAVALALAGCGGDEESSPPGATSPTATAEAAPPADETPEPQRSGTTQSAGETPQPQPTEVRASTSTTQESPTEPPAQMEEPTEDRDRTLTVYSGRSQSLVHPLLEAFGEWADVDIRVKYAGSASTAATLMEEGDNTPADVVFLQDPDRWAAWGRTECWQTCLKRRWTKSTGGSGTPTGGGSGLPAVPGPSSTTPKP